MAETPLLPEEPPDFWDWEPPQTTAPEEPLSAPDFEALLQELGQSQTLEAPPLEGDYTPQSLLERYLAAQPTGNPDVAEAEALARARTLRLSDARFLALENLSESGQTLGYEVGAMEVYLDPTGLQAHGQYLTVAVVDSLDALENAYFPLQMAVEYGGVGPHTVKDFAEFAAQEQGQRGQWREATPNDLEAYWAHVGLSLPEDDPPLEVFPELLREGERLSGTSPVRDMEGSAAFRALSAIGVKAEDFNPEQDPPPFYDVETGTAYWIGVFQPDLDDPEDCYASILSLGRNPETGELEAQLAPCVSGDWDKAYQSSQHLLGVMQKEGIDACFLAAESMAVATDQRELWENERGVTVNPGYAQEVAEYAKEAWELEL
ncbi:hypothetical protein ARNL5_03654 [Anaerolineae bacterium]|nr:hypothetical protein ARNL5_03654 [Anaerolineae bacterium]